MVISIVPCVVQLLECELESARRRSVRPICLRSSSFSSVIWQRVGCHLPHYWVDILEVYLVVSVKGVAEVRQLCASVATIVQIMLHNTQNALIAVASVRERLAFPGIWPGSYTRHLLRGGISLAPKSNPLPVEAAYG